MRFLLVAIRRSLLQTACEECAINMVYKINRKEFLSLSHPHEFKGMRWQSVREFALATNKALHIVFYGFDVLAALVKNSIVAWVSAISLKTCRYNVQFLISAKSHRVPFRASRCKSRFNGTSPDVHVNVYQYLADSGTPHIAPLHKNQLSQKSLDNICYNSLEYYFYGIIKGRRLRTY